MQVTFDRNLGEKSGTRLLIAEDDVKLARTIARGLEREGYEVEVAHTGDDALARAYAHDYDVVILDVLLPGPDGHEICRVLREGDRWVMWLMRASLGGGGESILVLDAAAEIDQGKP